MHNLSQEKRRFLIVKYALAGIIAVSIGIYFRLYPLTSFTSNSSSEKAAVFVISKIRILANHQIAKQYPNATNQEKDILAEKVFTELLRKESKNIRESIEKVSKDINNVTKTRQRYPYLLASDSFYYYGLTENIIDKGKLGGPIKGSKYLNKQMLAPLGHWEPITLHPYIGYYIYKFLKIFNPSIELMYAVSFTPLVITFIALIPFIMICYLLECGSISTFIGSVFFLLAPIFVKRSTFGWYDNDPYNILFPLLIITCIISGINNSNNIRKLLITAILSALFLLFYALFWQGWVLLFAIIGIAFVLIMFLDIVLKPKHPEKNAQVIRHFLFFSTIFISTFIFISVSFGINEFFTLFKEGWIALKNFITPQLSSWPDLYISVGELEKSSFHIIIKLLGGWFFFAISIFGIVYSLILSAQKYKKDKFIKVLIISIFFAVSFFITLGAQRFAILCLTPIGIAFVLGIQSIINISQRVIRKYFSNSNIIKKVLNTTIILILLSSSLIPIYNIHTSIDSLLNPIYNDTWKNALEKTKELTPKNSIITTWWPPGHFIKAIAKRRVSFDGATINVPQAYWISNIFLSTSETKALGILRMLNNSANSAVELLQKNGVTLANSILILNRITNLDKFKAKMILEPILKNESKIGKLLKLTHSRPAPSYILIYNEFVKNNLQLSFIGNWDFRKIAFINSHSKLLNKVPNRNSRAYIDFLWKLAGGQTKYSGIIPQISKVGKILLFPNNISINIDKMECTISSKKYGKGIPYSIFYRRDNKVIEKKFDNATLPFSVILVKDNNRHNIVLLDTMLARSFLIQLYFFDGIKFKDIKLVIKETDITKRTEILVFKVNWKDFEKDIKKN